MQGTHQLRHYRRLLEAVHTGATIIVRLETAWLTKCGISSTLQISINHPTNYDLRHCRYQSPQSHCFFRDAKRSRSWFGVISSQLPELDIAHFPYQIIDVLVSSAPHPHMPWLYRGNWHRGTSQDVRELKEADALLSAAPSVSIVTLCS